MVIPPRYSLTTALDWSYGGVNSSIPGNGGAECASFLSIERRLLETLVACCLSVLYTWWGWRCITLPATLPFVRKDRGGKRVLLVVVSLVFGMEIGFKFATKQLIYLLNPCHVTTALQIYLLAAPPSRFVTVLFRVHLNYLNGAVLAILFPVTNSRLLPLEEELYWMQHGLMLVTPYYLLRLGGVYTIEDLRDVSWSTLSTGLVFLYHFLLLQTTGMLAQVNLNNMLCPAISDPFYGPNYRMAALVHQSLCIPLVSKTFCALATFFLTVFPLTKVKDNLGTDVTMSAYSRHHSNRCRHHGDLDCSSAPQHRLCHRAALRVVPRGPRGTEGSPARMNRVPECKGAGSAMKCACASRATSATSRPRIPECRSGGCGSKCSCSTPSSKSSYAENSEIDVNKNGATDSEPDVKLLASACCECADHWRGGAEVTCSSTCCILPAGSSAEWDSICSCSDSSSCAMMDDEVLREDSNDAAAAAAETADLINGSAAAAAAAAASHPHED